MKVAMVTPLAANSAIADVMLQAMPELMRHWDLHVWAPAAPELLASPAPTETITTNDRATLEALGRYDLVVYVLGDSPFHTRILPLARRLPGLVVMHDAAITNLVRGSALELNEMPQLLAHVRDTAGAVLAEELERFGELSTQRDALEVCARLPLDSYAIESSLGVVVHSRWHARRVDGFCLGDVTLAPLPVPSFRTSAEDASVPAPELATLPDDALLVVTVGNLNANRRVDLILRAIGSDPRLKTRAHVWSVGSADPTAAAEAREVATELGLGSRFVVTGHVSDGTLAKILDRADVGVALRKPVLEGQSASTLTMMRAGLPVVVYDDAHYSELPDDAVVKVPALADSTDVRRALRELADDPVGRVGRGQRARDYVLTQRTGQAYAEAIRRAGELALTARVRDHLRTDLAARLHRLRLHDKGVIVDAALRSSFELFDLA